jgi:ubiquinone/menaquinone biosynthesis C-methylase UbiE
MEDMSYFFEVFESLPRCGPGDNKSTRQAYSFCRNVPVKPKILDIGCGTGEQTIELAKISKGKIIALDNHQPFLDILKRNATKSGLSDLITTKNLSMLNMHFEDNSFDIVWSEGALYFMGFDNGLKKCFQLLKNEGYLVLSEAVYLKPNPPQEVKDFWEKEYSDITLIKNKIKVIEKNKFLLLTHFTLPKKSWLEKFYSPMEKVISKMNIRNRDNKNALAVIKSLQEEINFYKKYSDYYGYEFFIMQKKRYDNHTNSA